MNAKALTLTAVLTAGALVGCKDDQNKNQPGQNPSPAPAKTGEQKPAEGHGAHIELGTKTVAGIEIEAEQEGALKPGSEGGFEFTLNGGQKPKAVRAWVGVESGEGSTKAKAEEEEGGKYHAHVEVPSPIPPGSKVWVEIEPQAGDKVKASFDLK